jgi:membrane protein
MLQPVRESLWKRGGLSWRQLGRRVWTESNNDDIFGHSAELAYYFFLALFPALFLLISVFGIVAGQNSQLRGNLLQYLARMVPPSASQLINQTLDEILRAAGGSKVWLGLLGALWAASNGVTAVMKTLNAVYEQEETRPWFKRRIVIAVGLTIAVSILITAALVITLYGEGIAEFVGAQVALGSAAVLAWKIVQWPVMLVMLIVAFALVYYYGPDVRDQKWFWISPGSVIGVALWILASIGFRVYLQFFNSYSKTYGSLGAVIILMLWFYVSGLALLIGGEVNAEIEHEAARRGEPKAKEKGEKVPQEQRPAA